MTSPHNKHFKVVPHHQYYRLTHVPSGDYIQRYLSDFLTRKDALECRDRVIAAAPNWDWSDAGMFTNMPWDISQKTWDAIYASPRKAA